MVKVSKCAKIRNRYNQVPHLTQDTDWESDKLRYISLDLDLSITNGIDSNKIYDKCDDFNFEIVNFPFLDGDGIAPVPILYTFRNLFIVQEYVLMLMTLTIETKF